MLQTNVLNLFFAIDIAVYINGTFFGRAKIGSRNWKGRSKLGEKFGQRSCLVNFKIRHYDKK